MVRFVTIGTNFITDLMLEAARKTEWFELYAVYSRTEERARQSAQKYGAQVFYTDMDQVCKDANIDAVYIASPTFLHKAHAIQCMNAGKHVLCEKPIAPNEQDYLEMLECAERNNVLLLEAMRPAYSMGWQMVEDFLPRIAPLRRVTLQFCQYSSRYDKFKQGIVENAFKPELCNGALMDIGVYCVHVMQKLLGLPRTVQAQTTFLPASIDGQGTIIADYGEVMCELIYSKITQGQAPSQLQGEQGCILVDSVSNPTEITLQLRGGAVEKYEVPGSELDILYELEGFYGQLKNGADARQQEGSRNTLHIMDEVRTQTGIDFVAKI